MSNHLHQPDRRAPIDHAADLVDSQLVDFYQSHRLFEALDDAHFTRAQVLNLVRDAYLEGVADKTHDPAGLSRFSSEFNSSLSRTKSGGAASAS